MGSINAVARRVLTFLPYTLPLWLFTSVPFISHNDTVRMVLYIAAIFAIPMVMDLVGGRGANRSIPDDRPMAEYAWVPRLLMVKFLIIQALMLRAIMHKGIHGVDLIVLAVVVGLYYGAQGIVVAHELMHRANRVDQWLAEILLVTVTYPHFCIEHVYGHHLNVATPADPASARRGENVYGFVARSVTGSLGHAWKIETDRLKRRGLGVVSVQNRMLRMALFVAIYYAIAYAVAGMDGVLVIAGQSAVAVFSLELINYMQHYGLQRKEISPGRYERTDMQHSWNWETRFSGLFFLNLGRHSEHHRIGNRPYEALTVAEGQPELPGGLMWMYLAALLPPVWFAIMNPRVDALLAAQATRPAGAPADLSDLKTQTVSARRQRQARYQSAVDAWGGFFIAAILAAMALTNERFGFQGGVILALAVGLAVVVIRGAWLALPEPASAA